MGFNIHILSVRNRSTNLPSHAALAASFNQPRLPKWGLKLNQLDRFRPEAGLPCLIAKVRWAQTAVTRRRRGAWVKGHRRSIIRISLGLASCSLWLRPG